MLKRFNKIFRHVFEQLGDPVLLVDAEGRIRSANASAERELDLGAGGRLSDVVSISDDYVFDGKEILAAVTSSRPLHGFRLSDAQGEMSQAVVDLIALNQKWGRTALWLIHIKDFSTVKNYERWKDDLVPMVAHEIKNPLTAMKNSMSILLSQATGPVTEGQNKLLTTSLRNIDRLTRLLDGLLDVSRIEAGRYTVTREWVNGSEVIANAVESFRTLFNVRQRLECEVGPEIDRLYVDEAGLEQVIINLLSNATKFTPQDGAVHVSVDPAGLEALPDDLRILPWREIAPLSFVRLRVSDDGIGMSGETLAHLYTRYFPPHDGDPVGSHLGLSISKSLIEAQDGEIEVVSEPGVGTQVTVYLPADERTAALLARLRSVQRCLDNATRARHRASFSVIVKESDRDWFEIASEWPRPPVANPMTVKEEGAGFVMWTLSERVALALGVDESGSAAMGAFFGLSAGEGAEQAAEADGYRIVCYRVREPGARIGPMLGRAVGRLQERENRVHV